MHQPTFRQSGDLLSSPRTVPTSYCISFCAFTTFATSIVVFAFAFCVGVFGVFKVCILATVCSNFTMRCHPLVRVVNPVLSPPATSSARCLRPRSPTTFLNSSSPCFFRPHDCLDIFCAQTERFLSPTGAQQHASKLQRPQHYSSSVSSAAGLSNGSPDFLGAAADPVAGNGAGVANGEEREAVDGFVSRGDSRDETIERLNKVLRTRNLTIKVREEETCVRG